MAPEVLVTIEKASTQDLDRLYEIERRCFREEAFTKQQIAYLLTDSNSVCLLSRAKREIVGFIMGRIGVSNESANGHILTIDVLPKHRRKGIGLKLLEKIEEEFKDGSVKICRLEAREDNVVALNLYKKFGYRKIGRLKDYYGTAHGILLEKVLT